MEVTEAELMTPESRRFREQRRAAIVQRRRSILRRRRFSNASSLDWSFVVSFELWRWDNREVCSFGGLVVDGVGGVVAVGDDGVDMLATSQ